MPEKVALECVSCQLPGFCLCREELVGKVELIMDQQFCSVSEVQDGDSGIYPVIHQEG